MDKIICIGKNYLEHAKELGDAVPEMPVLFLKPPSSLVQVPMGTFESIALPKSRGQVHPECEIVARIQLENGTPKFDAVTLGLDMTLRDVQARLKKAGHPWEVSKVFAGAAILGPWIPLSDFPDYMKSEFSFTVEGKLRQKGLGQDMWVNPIDCLRYAAEYFPICDGDLLFTGTPAGVGPVEAGQTSVLSWGNRLRFEVRFA